MRALPEAVRPWPYLLAGLLVGFLFLAEFALITITAVQAGLIVLAIAGLVGAARRWRALEYWPLFTGAAILTPFVSDSHVVGLPRCGTVAAGVSCFAGTRELVPQFTSELVTFVISFAGITLLIARLMAAARVAAR